MVLTIPVAWTPEKNLSDQEGRVVRVALYLVVDAMYLFVLPKA